MGENAEQLFSPPKQAPSLTCWDFALLSLPSFINHPLPHKKMHLGVHSSPSSSRISCGSPTGAPGLLTEKYHTSLKFRHG